MRKIIAYLATSADGYIARPDGSVEWLDRPDPRGNDGMAAFYRSIDTIALTLRSCRRFADGVVRLHYLVGEGPSGTRGR